MAVESDGTAYGARYVVPLIPLIFVPLVMLPRAWLWRTPGRRFAAVALCALSVLVNAAAAVRYWRFWDSNPLFALFT